MKRAAGYIKVGKGVKSEKTQRSCIEEYCLKNDMEVAEWLTEDIGTAAYGNWMRGRMFDAVVVADSAYVSKDIYEFYAYKSVLKRRHSDLIAVESRFAGSELYRTILDKLLDKICEVEVANSPLKTISDRTDKVARGAYIGGRAPMGYRIADGRLEVEPKEAEIVKFVIDRKRQGKSMLGTMEALNLAGYKTRAGKEFVISTVQSIWNNEMFYKGYRRYGKDGEWVKGQHEAIVSK